MTLINDIYLSHHGIKGQKWGVRRFQNPDGTLTEAGEKRYNKDSDALAESARDKFRAVADSREKARRATASIGNDPKKFGKSKERSEYLSSVDKTEKVFKQTNNLIKKLEKKYQSVDYDFYTEEKTGEMYAKSILTDKYGKQYVSEIKIGYRVED